MSSPPVSSASSAPAVPASAIDHTASDYQAQLVSQSTPSVSVHAGDNLTVTATLKNTGKATWYSSYLNLGTINPQDRCPGFDTVSGWYKCNRAKFQEASVAPGQTATFTMTWHVPVNKVQALFHETFQPVADEITWLADPKPAWDITILPAQASAATSGPAIDHDVSHYSYSLVGSPNLNQTIKPGQTATFTVSLKNTGTATWYQDYLSLGTAHPQDFVPGFDINLQDRSIDGWYKCNRIRFTQTQVAPGQTATFTFRMTAPSTKLPGTYRYFLQPVVDEVGWLADPNLPLTVTVQ